MVALSPLIEAPVSQVTKTFSLSEVLISCKPPGNNTTAASHRVQAWNRKKRRKPTSSWKRQDPQVFTGQRELWRQQLESHGMLSCMRFEVVPAKFPCYRLQVWTSKSSSGHSHLHLYTKSFNSYSFVVLILVGWNCSQLRCSKGCPIIVRNMILFRECFLEW